jgi:hypothetical protein
MGLLPKCRLLLQLRFCEAWVIHFPKEFGVSQKRRYTESRGNRFGQQPLIIGFR